MNYVNNKMPVACWKFKVAGPLSFWRGCGRLLELSPLKSEDRAAGRRGETLPPRADEGSPTRSGGRRAASTVQRRVLLRSSHTWPNRAAWRRFQPEDNGRGVFKGQTLRHKESRRGSPGFLSARVGKKACSEVSVRWCGKPAWTF